MPRRKQRIGIFGGTFSPPHYGHLISAERTREAANLDRIEWVVSATPPNKPFGVLDAEDRFAMTVAATADNPYFNASRIDIEHGGSGYSLLTVEAMQRRWGSSAELFFLTSAEYLDPEHKWYLPNWIGGPQLMKLCTFLVFPRDKTGIDQTKEWAARIPQARIEVLDVPSPALSSTLIRDLVVAGKSTWYTTPWPVQTLIMKKGHFRTAGTPLAAHYLVPPEDIKRVAIYGGQFDPIHYGHLLFAEWVRQVFNHDRVLFVPSGDPPNAEIRHTAEDRYSMVVAATAENPYFDTSRIDIDRRTKSYALLVAEDVRRKFGQQVELDMLLSSDYLEPSNEHYLPRWMGAESLMKMVRFIVHPAGTHDEDKVKELARGLPEARIEVVCAPTLPVTSADIRDLTAAGRSIRYMTPQVVQQTIAKTGLYQGKRNGGNGRKSAK